MPRPLPLGEVDLRSKDGEGFLSNIYHHGICNPAAGWFVYKADRHPAAAGTERNERSNPSMFQSLGPLLNLLGGGSLTKLLLFLLKGLFG